MRRMQAKNRNERMCARKIMYSTYAVFALLKKRLITRDVQNIKTAASV